MITSGEGEGANVPEGSEGQALGSAVQATYLSTYRAFVEAVPQFQDHSDRTDPDFRRQ
jgi:hypothetical protein